MAPKRRLGLAAGDNGGAPPGKRLRVAAAAAAGPPSPGRRLLRQTVFVVLFLIRAADRNAMDSISQIGRVVREEVRRCLDPIFRGYSLLVSKLESIEERIQALTHKVDQITPSRPNHHNHQQLVHEPNQEGTIEEGLATNKGKDKSTIARLRFLNGMKTPIYHDDEIKSDSNGAIKIGIFDGEDMIKSDKLSKVRVEIVALEGNFPDDVTDSWTAKEFNEHRAVCRDGKGNVLAGKCTVQLSNGVASLGSIKFREGSCRARKGMFIVGARVCDGVRTGGRVQEAIMNPVVVQDRRNKANEKSHPPKLDDRVHRLEEIAKDGTYCKRLEEARISTVQDFLRALNKNPDNLTKVLKIKKEHKSWEKMVRHAQDCCLKGKHELQLCRYTEGNVVLFFNCVHFLVGAVFDGHYTASDKFNPAHQAIVDKLKEHAYDQLDVLPFDHVMKDDFPVQISMNTDTSAAQPNDQVEFQTQHFLHRDDIIEASTSARSNIVLTTQQLTFYGAPGPAQVSMQSQRQAPLPSNGSSVALDQAALAMGHEPHEMPFANTDTSVSPWFQEQPFAYENIPHRQPDYEMDNGKPRPINQCNFQGPSMLEAKFTDPMQGHIGQEIFAERNIHETGDQQGTSGSGSHSKQCILKRLGSMRVTQNDEDESFDIRCFLDFGSEQYCASNAANEITGSVTLRCPTTAANEITGSAVLNQASLAMDHEAYDIPFANNDASVRQLYQEQPVLDQFDASRYSVSALADVPMYSRHSSFKENCHDTLELGAEPAV